MSSTKTTKKAPSSPSSTAKKPSARKPSAKASATKKPSAKATSAKNPSVKATATKNPSVKATAAKNPSVKATAAKSPSAKASAAKKPMAKRDDFGAPIDTFFEKHEKFRPLLNELRKIIEGARPKLESALKWGMPCFSLDGKMVCAINAHKAHVNLILSGPPETFADPNGRLEGGGENARRLKLTGLDELPRAEVQRWVAASIARPT